MSLNLRGPDDPAPHDWAHRRPLCTELFRVVQPDVIGTQEALFSSLQQLRYDSPADAPLEWTGLGRTGGSTDEHSAVLHRADRWRVVALDHLALSAKPRSLGTRHTRDQGCPRMVTWVRLADTEGREVTVVNTHLDHASAQARARAASQLAALVETLPGPLVMTGDFNDVPGSETWTTLTSVLTPACPAGDDHPSTFHGYGDAGETGCIDWILQRGFTTATWWVVHRNPPVSDHHPVVADLLW